MSAFTPNFLLEYLAPGEPIKNTRAVLERMAKSIDAALTRGGVAPPNSQDLVAVAGRTATLESKITPGAWVAPNLATTGMATYTGDGADAFSYRLDAGRQEVAFRGYLNNPAAVAANGLLFVLAAGHRPTTNQIITTYQATGVAATGNYRLMAYPNGEVRSVYAIPAGQYLVINNNMALS